MGDGRRAALLQSLSGSVGSMATAESVPLQRLPAPHSELSVLLRPPGVEPLASGGAAAEGVGVHYRKLDLAADVDGLHAAGVRMLVTLCPRRELTFYQLQQAALKKQCDERGMDWLWCPLGIGSLYSENSTLLCNVAKTVQRIRERVGAPRPLVALHGSNDMQLTAAVVAVLLGLEGVECEAAFHMVAACRGRPFSGQQMEQMKGFVSRCLAAHHSLYGSDSGKGNSGGILVEKRENGEAGQGIRMKLKEQLARYRPTLVVGNVHKATNRGIHHWRVFVRRQKLEGGGGGKGLNFIKSVTFYRHDTEQSETLTRPPFDLEGQGRVTFVVDVTITFRSVLRKLPLRLEHELCFDGRGRQREYVVALLEREEKFSLSHAGANARRPGDAQSPHRRNSSSSPPQNGATQQEQRPMPGSAWVRRLKGILRAPFQPPFQPGYAPSYQPPAEPQRRTSERILATIETQEKVPLEEGFISIERTPREEERGNGEEEKEEEEEEEESFHVEPFPEEVLDIVAASERKEESMTVIDVQNASHAVNVSVRMKRERESGGGALKESVTSAVQRNSALKSTAPQRSLLLPQRPSLLSSMQQMTTPAATLVSALEAATVAEAHGISEVDYDDEMESVHGKNPQMNTSERARGRERELACGFSPYDSLSCVAEEALGIHRQIDAKYDVGVDTYSEEDFTDDTFDEREEVSQLLAALSLSAYAPAFAAHEVTLRALVALTEEDLRSLGVADSLHRIEILQAARELVPQADVFDEHEPQIAPPAVGYREISYAELQLHPQPFAAGAFGEVTLGTWRGQAVAVKKLRSYLQDHLVLEFRREAAVMERLNNHPAIAFFIGVCTDADNMCLITQYYGRGSAYDLLVKGARVVAWKRVVQIAKDAASGILHLHKEGFLHCDIAARNVLVSDDYRGRVSDFGMSRVKKAVASAAAKKPEGFDGPVRWMAPELLREGDCTYTAATDAFSFGVTLYEFVARERPWAGLSKEEVKERVLAGERLPIPAGCTEVFAALMRDCWQEEAAARPSFACIWRRLHEYHSRICAIDAGDVDEGGAPEALLSSPASLEL